MFNETRAARNEKNVFPSTASHSTRSQRMRWISAHNSPTKLARNRLAGSAAGTRLIPRLTAKPNAASPSRIRPDHPCSPRNNGARSPPATIPRMMAIQVPSSRMPFPHDNSFSDNSSGSSPYFEGPKNALCTPIRNTHTNGSVRCPLASPRWPAA